MGFVRRALLNEADIALIRRHQGVDPAFTYQRFAVYANNFLQKISDPILADSVERVGRDAPRKLARLSHFSEGILGGSAN